MKRKQESRKEFVQLYIVACVRVIRNFSPLFPGEILAQLSGGVITERQLGSNSFPSHHLSNRTKQGATHPVKSFHY